MTIFKDVSRDILRCSRYIVSDMETVESRYTVADRGSRYGDSGEQIADTESR
jgi:hypothetical protein